LCGPFQHHQIDLALTLALHALTDLSSPHHPSNIP
jgi:hypothetical protein